MTETATAPKTFAEAEVLIAQGLPGYEPRPQQQELARRIEQHLSTYTPDNPRTLLAQAPTGVGKSLAYAIPAILSRRPVCISVTTKNLQDQLAFKDVPFLEAHLPVPFTWAVLKGRSNYLDLNIALSLADPTTEAPHLGKIIEYANANPDFDGLRESLPFSREIEPTEWSRICASPDGCQDAKCSDQDPGTEQCYATKAIRKANASQLVIVNHSLLATDLELTDKDIPRALSIRHAIILDEAHEFEEVVANTIGYRISRGTFTALVNNVRTFVADWASDPGDIMAVQRACNDLGEAADALFADMDQMKEFKDPNATTVRLKKPQVRVLSPSFAAVGSALIELQNAWDEVQWPYLDGKQKIRRSRYDSAMSGLGSRIQQVISGKDDPEAKLEQYVRWIEIERARRRGQEDRKVIRCSPISVAPFLRKNLFSRFPVVAVSATLTVKGGFKFITDRLGAPDPDTLMVDSPFDFYHQGKLYVPRHLPSPKKLTEWEYAAEEEIVQLVKASGGRALLLFTSLAHMRRVAESLRRRVNEFEILVQGEDDNAALGARFKAETTSVLLASKSFMTGFDAPGNTLTLLVISKLPYAVPSEPVTQARCELIEAQGGNAYSDYSIPMMSLVLQQAAGRVIRHTEDTGVVAILDNRITAGILADLPPFQQVNEFEKVAEFLQFMCP